MAASNRRRPAASRAAARPTRAEQKRQLLDHAKQLFVTLGYRQTTTEQIAAAAGVSEAVLRRHYESKQELFLEVLAEIREATLTRWKRETEPLADPLAKLHAILDNRLGSSRQHAREFHILHRSLLECAEEEEIRTPLRDFYQECEAFFAAIIAEGQQSGVFRRPLDPRVARWEIVHTMLGYSMTEPLGVPLFSESGYLAGAIDCLLHCLLKTDV